MLFIDRHGEAAGAALNALARADYAARLENELSAAYGKSVAATSSVDAAIHTALRLCGVQSGDYVFVPTFTFYSYVATVAHTGAVPVFLDCDPTTRCVSAAALETALMWAELQGKPPTAVVADNAFGSIADFDVLAPLCKAWGAPLIELCCDAFGGEYNGRPCGGSGDYGVICCDKRLTGGGGAVVCGEDRSEAWEFARVKYTAGENHDYRINNFDAALWLEQRAVSEKLTARARKNLAALATSLDCVVPPTAGDAAVYALCKAAGRMHELRSAGFDVKKPPLVHTMPQYEQCHYFEHEPDYSACRAFDDCCLIGMDISALARLRLARMLKTRA